jgi:hypothetical protein
MNRFHIFLFVSAMGTSFTAPCFAQTENTSPSKFEADVVYGHKDGLALTMDVYQIGRAHV